MKAQKRSPEGRALKEQSEMAKTLEERAREAVAATKERERETAEQRRQEIRERHLWPC